MSALRHNEIWIADDNADVRVILERAFKRGEFGNPVFFSNGAKLLEEFQKSLLPPKLFLIDLQMPIMDGLSTLKALRQAGSGPTPALIFSSLENPEVVRAAYSSGAKLYLKKPDRIEEYDAVAKLCATCAALIKELPASAVPAGALDVKRVFELIAMVESSSV